MRNFATITSGYKYIAVNYFVFNSQTDVRYVVLGGFNEHLSKRDLIVCINYFLTRLNRYDFSDRIKQGFVLEKFKYYELSVYLHGILQLYAANICLPPLGDLYITRFSHLPHDILKPEKVKKDLEISLVNDFYYGRYYTCIIKGVPVCSHSILTLKAELFLRFPSLRDYDINFIIN